MWRECSIKFTKDGDYYEQEEIVELKKYAHNCEVMINRLLLSGGADNYRTCCDILKDESIVCLFTVSKVLMNASIIADVEIQQLNRGDTITVFSNRDLSDLENIYQEMVYRLRRVEFGISIDINSDIVQFLYENKLTMEFLVSVLRGTVYLYSKNRILNLISEGLKNE